MKQHSPEPRGRTPLHHDLDGTMGVVGQAHAIDDRRSAAVSQRALAGYIDRSPRMSLQRQQAARIQDGRVSNANRTGMPDGLKAGIEQLSGMALDDVKVHYNSPAPAQLNADAFAQGSAIHLAPGQAHHLPHEAWHVAQQKQGRVQPSAREHGVAINADPALEQEADGMGSRAEAIGAALPAQAAGLATARATPVVQRVSDRKLKAAVKQAGHDLTVVDAFQTAAALSDMQIKALLNVDLLGTALALGAVTVKKFGDDVVESVRARKTNLELQQAEASVVARPKTIVDELEEAGLSPIYGETLKGRETAADLRAIIAERPAHMEAILQCAAARANRLADVRALLVKNAAGRQYDAPQVLQWAASHGVAVADAALDGTAHEKNVDYVDKWLSYSVTAASNIQLKYLVRFQALRKTTGAALSREKADKKYAGNNDNRTGFLMYTFSDGAVMKIHTHWNVIDKKIVSSHVQDGQGENGIEINQWSWFGNVSQAILEAQNAATPTGGPLTM